MPDVALKYLSDCWCARSSKEEFVHCSVCMCLCVHACERAWVCVYSVSSMSVCTWAHLWVCLYAGVHVWTCVCISQYTFICHGFLYVGSKRRAEGDRLVGAKRVSAGKCINAVFTYRCTVCLWSGSWCTMPCTGLCVWISTQFIEGCGLSLQPNYGNSKDSTRVYGTCAIGHTTVLTLILGTISSFTNNMAFAKIKAKLLISCYQIIQHQVSRLKLKDKNILLSCVLQILVSWMKERIWLVTDNGGRNGHCWDRSLYCPDCSPDGVAKALSQFFVQS